MTQRVTTSRVLIAGTVASVAISMAAWRWSESIPANVAFLVAVAGVSLTLTLDHRLKLSDLERAIVSISTNAELEVRINDLSKVDPQIREHYEMLRGEIGDLAKGTYKVAGLESVYLDDINYISRMKRGQHLRSTCPVTTVSVARAIEQLSSRHYEASIAAHVNAARRGVKVTRIYLFRSREYAADTWTRKHLAHLETLGIDTRVLIRDETSFEEDFDYLIFGDSRVSVGLINPDSGLVSGAVIYTEPRKVRKYVDGHERMLKITIGPTDI